MTGDVSYTAHGLWGQIMRNYVPFNASGQRMLAVAPRPCSMGTAELASLGAGCVPPKLLV